MILKGYTKEQVESTINNYFKILKEGIANVERKEYDFLFIGKLRVNKKILSRYEKNLKYYKKIEIRDKYLDYCKKIRNKLDNT